MGISVTGSKTKRKIWTKRHKEKSWDGNEKKRESGRTIRHLPNFKFSPSNSFPNKTRQYLEERHKETVYKRYNTKRRRRRGKCDKPCQEGYEEKEDVKIFLPVGTFCFVFQNRRGGGRRGREGGGRGWKGGGGRVRKKRRREWWLGRYKGRKGGEERRKEKKRTGE